MVKAFQPADVGLPRADGFGQVRLRHAALLPQLDDLQHQFDALVLGFVGGTEFGFCSLRFRLSSRPACARLFDAGVRRRFAVFIVISHSFGPDDFNGRCLVGLFQIAVRKDQTRRERGYAVARGRQWSNRKGGSIAETRSMVEDPEGVIG